MGTVVDLSARQERRATRERELALSRSHHPSLRWVAGAAFYVAHRKADGAAACGARGSLTLAPPGVPLCIECYPLTPRDGDE